MIEHVNAGDEIKASTINQVIDAAQGQGIPGSGMEFYDTSNGPVFRNYDGIEVDGDQNPPPFLAARWGWNEEISGNAIDLMLGRDIDQAKTLVRVKGQPVKDFGVYDANSGQFKKLVSSDWQVNGEENVYFGYVPTGISALKGDSGCGTLYAYVCEGQPANSMIGEMGGGGRYCVFSNSDKFSEFGQMAAEEFGERYGLSVVDMAFAVASEPPEQLTDPSSGDPYDPVLLQGHVGSLEVGQNIDYCQFQLTAFIETSSVAQQSGPDKNYYRARICWWNWYRELVTPGGNIADSPVKWNSEPIFSKGRYTFGWNELSCTDWNEGGLKDGHQSYYINIHVRANPYIPKYPAAGESETYIWNEQPGTDWSITSAYIPPRGEDHENETHIAQTQRWMGYNVVKAQYQLGSVYLYGTTVRVHQCQHGGMNFMQFDWTHCPLDTAGPGIEGWFKPDCEISDSQTSSIERDTYTYKISSELSDGTWEEHEETGYYFRHFDFKSGGDKTTNPVLSCTISDDWVTNEDCTILVRQEGEHGIGQRGNAVLKYARLSVCVPNLSVDSMVENTAQYSMALSNTWKGWGTLGLYGFHQKGSNHHITLTNLSNETDNKVQILVREQDDDGVLKLKYSSLKVDLSGSADAENGLTDLCAQLSTDSEVPEAGISSLARGTTITTVMHKNLSGEWEEVDIEAKYYKMYNFEGDERLQKEEENQGDYTVLVKKYDDGIGEGEKSLHYMDLSSFADKVSCDSEDEQLDQMSLEYADDDRKTLQLYNFDSQAPDLTVVVSREENDTEEDSHILVRDFEDSAGGELRYATLSIDFGRSVSVDTEFDNDTKSIDSYGDDNSRLRLHNFDSSGSDVELKYDHDNQTGTESDYQFLVRNNRELKYATLSIGIPEDLSSKVDELSNDISGLSSSMRTDSEVPAAEISSLERRDDEDGKYYSVYKFHDKDYRESKEDLPESNTQVLARNTQDGKMHYIDLSSFGGDISCDSEDEQLDQQSIEFADDDRKTLQLYNFDSQAPDLTVMISREENDTEEDSHILVRDFEDSAGGELRYATLSVDFGRSLSADTEETPEVTKTIDVRGEDILTLHNFQSGSTDLTAQFTHDDPMSDFDGHFLVRDGNELKYAKISCQIPEDLSSKVDEISADLSAISASMRTDSEVPGAALSSLERREDEDGNKYYSMYRFSDESYKTNKDDLDGSAAQVLVRNTEDGTLNYVELSAFGSETNLSADSDIEDEQQKSIEKIDDNATSASYFQLYGFDKGSRPITLSVDQDHKEIPQDYSILVRHTDESGNTVLDYANLSVNLSAGVSCDTQGNTGRKSIDRNSSDELQIHNFANGSTDLTAQFSHENPTSLFSGQFLVRDGSEIKYAQISVGIPEDISSKVDELSGKTDDISALIAEISAVDSDITRLNQNSLERAYVDDEAYVQLYNFDAGTRPVTLSIDQDHKEIPSDYSILVRHTDGSGNTVLDYANLSVNISAGVSCDSQGTTNKRSLQYNTSNQLELYNFHNGSTAELTVKFDNGNLTNSGSQILVRNGGQLKYAALSCVPRTDSSYYSSYSNSISWNTSQNCLQINGFNSKSNKTVTEVSSYSSQYDVLMRRHNGSQYTTEYINVAPLLSGGGAQGETTDLTVITQVVWDSSNHRIQPKGKVLKFVNGLLSSVGQEQNVGYISTTPWTSE